MFALLSWLILDPVADDSVLRREADCYNVPDNPSETTVFFLKPPDCTAWCGGSQHPGFCIMD